MKTNILTLVITLVVGIILAGSLLAPVISDAQNDLGDPITKINAGNDYNLYMREVKDGDTLVCTVTSGENSTITLNGEPLLTIDGTSDYALYHSYIFSDVFGANTSNATDGFQVYTPSSTTISYVNQTCTITYNDGTFAITVGENTYTYSGATWGFIACNKAEAEFYESVRSGDSAHYIKSDSDFVCCGVYTTGDNDTFYTYYNGVASCSQDYECSATITKSIAEGTTDIYSGKIAINVGDETFTPYRILVPIEVTGHATTGAVYSLVGAIPILVIVAILMVAIGAIALRRND